MSALLLLFIIPLKVLVFLEIKDVNVRIDFTRKERMGADVNRNLRRFMEHILMLRLKKYPK